MPKPSLDSFMGGTKSSVKPPLGSFNVQSAAPDKKKSNIFGTIGNALISSEKAVGNDLTAGTRAGMAAKNSETLNNAQFNTEKTLQDRIKVLKAAGQDSSHTEKALADIRAHSIANNGDISKDVPEVNKSGLQGLGDVGGVALDVLSAGTYGAGAKGAKAGQLFTKADKAIQATKAAEELAKVSSVAKNVETAAKFGTKSVAEPIKKGLGTKLLGIGKKTAVRSAVGGATGYAYDVSQNLQEGKGGGEALKPGMGTLLGVGIPAAVGTIQAGAAITKEVAPKFINSLIKPKQADFSYGKDPGRTVSEMGIKGNNLNDFAENIHKAKTEIGDKIGSVYSNPQNSKIRINASEEIKKIDDAIEAAAKGGKENQGIVTTLQNTKDALLYEHKVNADGVIEKVGTTPRDLSALNPEEAFNLKKVVAEQTKFTGKPSDDKTVNSILKNIYGGIKEKLNSAVGINNPEIADLNQKYADLTSAELATRNREAIVRRTNMVSLPETIVGTGTAATALLTGSAALPATLIGISGVALEKALSSTAVRTRIASWLGKESPSVISKIIQKNPGIKTVLYRALPKFASQLGVSEQEK